MLRRNLLLAIAVATALAPLGAARAGDREWEEDYTDDWSAPGSPQPGYEEPGDAGAPASVSFDTFYGPLSPYGEWVVSASYGRVWHPRVAMGWRPYYYGRWEWTNEGWLWVSDEPWGWAAYHYGRWALDPGFGWIWVPGYEWAPAWVSWRFSAGVVGWAPLAPGLSVYVTAYPFFEPCWTFVPVAQFVSVPVYSVAYAPTYTRRFFGETVPAPARTAPRPFPGAPRPAPAPAWGGPAPRFVAERTGRPVTPVRVVPSASPVASAPRGGAVPIYRPDAFGPRGNGGRAFPGGGPPRGFGRGPGPAPAPGWDRQGGPGAPPNGVGRGPGSAPAPGWERRGGGPQPEPRREAAPQGGRGWGPPAAPRAPGPQPGGAPAGGGRPAPAPRGGHHERR